MCVVLTTEFPPMSVIMAFTRQQVAAIAGISTRMLHYWEQTGVFQASYLLDTPRVPFGKVYSFRDLVSLRTLALLRKTHHVPLSELRATTAYLTTYVDSPWTDLAIRLYGNHLAFKDPVSGGWISPQRGSYRYTFEIFLEDVSREAERTARKAMQRTPDHFGRITRNRNVMSNEWVIAGTRIPVAAVVSLAASGMSHDDILDQYPSLVDEDIAAALEHDRHPMAA